MTTNDTRTRPLWHAGHDKQQRPHAAAQAVRAEAKWRERHVQAAVAARGCRGSSARQQRLRHAMATAAAARGGGGASCDAAPQYEAEVAAEVAATAAVAAAVTDTSFVVSSASKESEQVVTQGAQAGSGMDAG